MAHQGQPDDERKDETNDRSNAGKESVTRDRGPKEPINASDAGAEPQAEDARFGLGRRSVLRIAGATAAVGAVGAFNAVGNASASVDVSEGDGYEIWRVSGKEVYDLSDGETLSNVLIDQTADGACLTIRSRNRTGWTVRNVGFVGTGEMGDGSNGFQFQVSTPGGGHGLIENVWASGKARGDQPSTKLGGIYLRSSHAGHIDIRNTYIEGFGNNAVYASAVGKDGGNDGSVTLENCYHRDNTVSQFRIGSPGSVVRNSVGIVDDPEGDRGVYPGTSSNRNARGVWGKHFRDQRFENCSFYISPDDTQPDGAFEARYIPDRSHGPEAVAEIVDCQVNADAPILTGSTSNARVNLTNLGESPTVTVIQDGGVPTSPEMAASGGREMPPELPGYDGSTSDGSTSDGSSDDDTSSLERTLTVDGTDADYTEYALSVSEDLAGNPDLGSLGVGDTIDGTTATGFVNGGTDGYRFAGEVTSLDVNGDADVVVDGEVVDPDSIGDTDPAVTTDAASDVGNSSATLNATVDSLGGADSVAVAFEWRGTGASNWNRTDAGSTSSVGSVSQSVSGLSADTDYEYRVTVEASDGDTATGSTVNFASGAALGRTLVIDGTDAGWTDYSVTVSGEVENDADLGSLGVGDSIEGSTATGFVNGGTDAYRFSGEIVDLSVDGDADVVVDGEVVDPGSLVLPNRLVFDAAGSSGTTTYEFQVSGDLTGDAQSGALESGDALDGSSVAGSVSGDDRDGYRFSGDLVSMTLDGEASVVFEDNDG